MNWIDKIATLLIAVLVLSACTDEQETHRQVPLMLAPYGQPGVEVATRALVSGYVKYTDLYPQPQMQQSSIGIYLVEKLNNTNTVGPLKAFTYNSTKGYWYSSVAIEENHNYEIYGFHPATGVSNNSSLNYTTPTAPVLTLPTLNACSATDVCVVVGVKRALNKTQAIEDSGIQLGDFSYTASENDNYVYLLMDHLFTCVNFEFKINDRYDELRDIRIRKVEITPETAKNVQVVVSLSPNTTGDNPITNVVYNETVLTDPAVPTVIYDKGDDGGRLNPTTALVIPSYVYVASDGSTSSYTLTTTYDVIDNADKVVRPACVANNKITLPNTLTRGKKYTFESVVAPTYLYQLSDNDLNNPVLTIN